MAGSYEYDNEPSVSATYREFLDPAAEQLLASHEGLFSMELVTWVCLVCDMFYDERF